MTTKTKLTQTARTILRSRIRRHPNSAQVVGARAVSDLTNADLLQAALFLSLDVPTKAEEEEYVDCKNDPLLDGITQADAYAIRNNIGGAGLGKIDVLAAASIPADEKVSVDDANDPIFTPERPYATLDRVNSTSTSTNPAGRTKHTKHTRQARRGES
ncbi:MAG: hypothetical protein U5N55_02190 [Cypionkella sp.]|nr:hypothetical protein [Cypionkella sp.]